MALSLLIDGVEHISELVHESLQVHQTNDGLNSTCSFDIRDKGVIEKDAWTVAETRVEDGDVITGHTVFSAPKVEVSVVDGATVYFAGVLSRVTTIPAGLIEVGSYLEPDVQILHCHCHDFNQILEESIIDTLEEYSMTSDELIIDDLFPKYVTGIDFATNVVAVQTYKEISFENISVRQALAQLIARSGAVCYVDYAKKLWHKAVGADSPAWHLSDVPDDVNSFSYLDPANREVDATNLVNRVFIIGSTGGTWFTDAASIAAYGDHRAIVKDTRLLSSAEVTLRGMEVLEKLKDPITTYVVRTYKDGLRAGMLVRFVCAYLDVDDTFLISRLRIEFPVDGEPIYELTLGGLASSVGSAAQRYVLDEIYSGPPIPPAQLPLASRGWGHDLLFSATDHNTVSWDGGTLTTASGQTFAIIAGNTDDPGAMTVKTVIYLDTAISLIDLQMTTDETAAIGANRIMVAVAWPGIVAAGDQPEVLAGFQVFGSTTELAIYLNATNVIANAITANEIYCNTLAAIAADMGALTAGTVTLTGGAGTGTVVLSTGGIGIWDAAANLRIRLNANDGTFKLTSAEAGNARIEIGNTEIVGYDGADVKQFYLSATDGIAYAGAGNVWLDKDGLSLTGAAAITSTVKWLIGGNVVADMKAYLAANEYWLYIQTLSPASINDRSKIYLEANAPAGSNDSVLSIFSGKNAVEGWASFSIEGGDRLKIEKDLVRAYDDLYVQDDLRVGKGLYVGQVGVDPDDDDIWCDGEVSTDGGTTRWDLGGYVAGAPTPDGYVNVTINGTIYKLLADLP